jgi:hypothetical protein
MGFTDEAAATAAASCCHCIIFILHQNNEYPASKIAAVLIHIINFQLFNTTTQQKCEKMIKVTVIITL